MTVPNHPWSSDPASQAAIRRAEVDRGPTLCHHEVPGAVERLAERVARLEEMSRAGQVSRDAAPDGAKCTERESGVRTEPDADAASPGDGWRWLEIGEEFQPGDEIVNARGEGHLRTSASMVREKAGIARKYRRRVAEPAADPPGQNSLANALKACWRAFEGDDSDSPQPVAAPVPDSAGAVGLRTELVTLEVCHSEPMPADDWDWGWLLRCNMRLGESVRVVPTPGPGLTEGERTAIEDGIYLIRKYTGYAANNRASLLESLLARDAAARDGKNTAWLREMSAGILALEHMLYVFRDDERPMVQHRLEKLRRLIEVYRDHAGPILRDASARESSNYAPELGSKLGGDDVARLTAERDAAIRERDEARREREIIREDRKKIKQTCYLRIAERDAAIRERDEARADAEHDVREVLALARRERDAALARVKELESAGEPVAWGIMRVGGGWMAILENTVQAETSRKYWDESENWVHEIVPLYAAPQQERVVMLPGRWIATAESSVATAEQWLQRLAAAGVRWEVAE